MFPKSNTVQTQLKIFMSDVTKVLLIKLIFQNLSIIIDATSNLALTFFLFMVSSFFS